MRSVYIYRMKEEKTIFKPLAGIEFNILSSPWRESNNTKCLSND